MRRHELGQAAQVSFGIREDGSPIWPCGPQPVDRRRTGYCQLAPGHASPHAGTIAEGKQTVPGQVWHPYVPCGYLDPPHEGPANTWIHGTRRYCWLPTGHPGEHQGEKI